MGASLGNPKEVIASFSRVLSWEIPLDVGMSDNASINVHASVSVSVI